MWPEEEEWSPVDECDDFICDYDDYEEEEEEPACKGCDDDTPPPPSCKSFKFKPITRTYQEANVRNIGFEVVLVEYIGGVQFSLKNWVELPKPTKFSAPITGRRGDKISAGLMATVSARALKEAMGRTINKYANKEVTNSVVEYFFRDELKRIYSLSIPGGSVQYNSNANPADVTEYATIAFGNDACY